MGMALMWEGIGQLIKIIGLLLGWWKETSDAKNKAKREAIIKAMEAADNDDQEAMRRAINDFNSV